VSSGPPRKRRRTVGYAQAPARPATIRIPRIPVLALALVALVVMIIIVSVSAYRLLSPSGDVIVLPDFAGQNVDSAQTSAARFGVSLRVVAHHNDEKIAKNAILGQFPAPGEHVRQGRVVDVIVSDGPTVSAVPDVTGLSVRDAQIALGNARLDLGKVTSQHSDVVAAGRILSQNPIAALSVPAGTKVDVAVAQGRPQEYVPNFIGLSLPFSTVAAKQTGVTLGPPLWLPIAKNAKPRGIVIAQDPLPGQPLNVAEKIILHVSGGPPPTPTPLPTLPPPPTPFPTQAATAAPESAPPSAGPSNAPSPSAAPAARSIRVQVALPSLPTPKRVRVVLLDASGSRDLYDQTTKGGFTLQLDITLTGAGTVQTYVEGVLTNTNQL
jgi:beta-lactam-binding protein with PASTA domain